jgi:hypothetical protein
VSADQSDLPSGRRCHTRGAIAVVDVFTPFPYITTGFLILQHRRRVIPWIGVTAHPSAEWIARQLTEAYAWAQAPQYIIRDRDGVYGDLLIRRLRAMGIRDRPITPRSPWQNGHTERLIGAGSGPLAAAAPPVSARRPRIKPNRNRRRPPRSKGRAGCGAAASRAGKRPDDG